MFGMKLGADASVGKRASLVTASEVVQTLNDEGVRAVQILVESETLKCGTVLRKRGETSGSLEGLKKDFGEGVSQVCDLKTPTSCYVALCLADFPGSESPSHAKGAWALVIFVPDGAPVKQKFLFANSTSQVKSLLPNAEWREHRASDADELSYHSRHFIHYTSDRRSIVVFTHIS
jgi:hypothetical protein